ncbi:MAG: parallel beta-helix domain-containing protein [Chakrabartia sp.]
MKRPLMQVATLAALLASPAIAATLKVAPGPNAQERLQSALIDAKPGDVVEMGAGRFDLTDGLSLDINGVTVKGAGPDQTILSFASQQGAGEGLLVTSDDVVLRDFAVEDAKGDGIKSKGADRIVYRNIRVEWTGGPKETNGAYGLYPVESRDVLIDGAVVKGASDAGIYVGQSRNIIVRNSTAMFNVAGIEIENSYDADVHHNLATHNTGGILIFDLPNLPQQGGHNIRVFQNRVIANDTPNFAPKGNIVASVPTGTGVMVMANRNVHVFDNDIADNGTTNVMIVAYQNSFTDQSYNPIARDIVVRGNRHGRAGFAPAFPGGDALAQALGGSFPAIFWDGVGGDAANVHLTDSLPAISLNLGTQGQPISNARPAPYAAPATPAPADLPAIVLPATMEAAAR